MVRTLSSVPRQPDYSSEDEDPEDLKKEALATGAGVQRAVWDLNWEGADKIKNGKIDTGDPAVGPRAGTGPCAVRLTVDGQTGHHRCTSSPIAQESAAARLDAQLALALGCGRHLEAHQFVNNVHSVREQLEARTKALEAGKRRARGRGLLAASHSAREKNGCASKRSSTWRPR